MEYRQREYPLFSACGLNCGLCPRYQMDGDSKCPGCAGKDFLSKHPTCGVLSCTQRRGLEFCFECNEFPCGKYDGADKKDSFITHLKQLSDMNRVSGQGISTYKNELEEKISILEMLLAKYNDGRRKSFFCLAINLLDLQDVKHVMEEIVSTTRPDQSDKERAAGAVKLFENMAESRGYTLKLRK